MKADRKKMECIPRNLCRPANENSFQEAKHKFVPFRPIQYLGSKLRVLDDIRDAAQYLAPKGANVGDFFSGSTVVSQTFSAAGYSVTSIDTQTYSSVLGHACLAIGRGDTEELDYDRVLFEANNLTGLTNIEEWQTLAIREQSAIKKRDLGSLRELYRGLPLIWKNAQNPHYSKISQQSKSELAEGYPLISAIYSGSYFGIEQALEVDLLRNAISQLQANGKLSQWQSNAALSSLLSAASSSVHSAGKHFAQPLKNHKAGDNLFGDRRLMEDRKISIADRFSDAARRINSLRYSVNTNNSFILGAAENISTKKYSNLDLVYLDPPYTAQQYSRFYHILETLCSYRFPTLLVQGQLTTGLYPIDRYKSAFSSKRNALSAFSTIVKKTQRAGASLLISYSHSANGSNGNARMISFEQILEVCKSAYGDKSVEWTGLKHKYRQFNSSQMANKKRNDPEVLVTCKNA